MYVCLSRSKYGRATTNILILTQLLHVYRQLGTSKIYTQGKCFSCLAA
jgi:hypothetical protein